MLTRVRTKMVGENAPHSILVDLSLASPAFAQDDVRVPWDILWRLEAAEARVERQEGRDALFLRNANAWLVGGQLRDGVIRFDLLAGDDLGFYGAASCCARATKGLRVRPFHVFPHIPDYFTTT